jgi:hypothetical protein
MILIDGTITPRAEDDIRTGYGTIFPSHKAYQTNLSTWIDKGNETARVRFDDWQIILEQHQLGKCDVLQFIHHPAPGPNQDWPPRIAYEISVEKANAKGWEDAPNMNVVVPGKRGTMTRIKNLQIPLKEATQIKGDITECQAVTTTPSTVS